MNKKVYISTYGCQMNVNDTERMYSIMEMINYAPSTCPEEANLVIINSCSVREKPVHKVRSEVGRLVKLKEKTGKNFHIGVAGCVASQERKKLLKSLPHIDFVMGPDAIDRLPHIVKKLEEKERGIVETRFTPYYHIQTLNRNPGVSAFINIMKGCDNFCTFCVVPFTRGRERSRPLEHVVEDVKQLIKRGVKEVTLLGQNVNSYRSPCGESFAGLLEALCKKTDISRIRFTSPHPKDFNDDVIHVMAAHTDRIMEAVHLPVQSGSTSILAKMNRGYSREEFIKKANRILKKIPGSVLSTDIIVGFPGETEKDFADTMSLLDEVPFETIYSFKYSPRPFTKAQNFPNPVPEEEKRIRLRRLNEKHMHLGRENAKKYAGKVLKVLVERQDQSSQNLTGRSTENKIVHFCGEKHLVGKEVCVKITKALPQVLYASVI